MLHCQDVHCAKLLLSAARCASLKIAAAAELLTGSDVLHMRHADDVGPCTRSRLQPRAVYVLEELLLISVHNDARTYRESGRQQQQQKQQRAHHLRRRVPRRAS